MELIDTIKGMLSDDYYERLMAEYDQLRIRYIKLKNMIENYDHLTFVPNTPKEILVKQLEFMKEYLKILIYRIDKEGYYHDDKIK